MITYKELVVKTMPAEKKRISKGCLLSFYLLRPIENVISIFLIELKVSAMFITRLGMISLIIALASFLLVPYEIGVIIGLTFIFVWNVFDGIDGNIARYTDTCSKKGELWDNACDYLAPCVFYIGMGITAYNCCDVDKGILFFSNRILFVYMGFLIALGNIYSRLIMYRKISLFDGYIGKGLKIKSGDAGLIRLVVQNIISVNGLAFVAFIICYIFSIMEFCIIFYFLIYICVVLGSMYKILLAK